MPKQLLQEYFQLCPDGICDLTVLTEDEKHRVSDGAVYLVGVVQRAGTKNGNGRIYKKETLQREVENYQKAISERRSLGECVDPETQIMTKDGWKYIADISKDEKIFTLNSETNEIELQEITRKVVLPFEGEMLHFTNGRSIDMMLTPTHNILYYTRNGNSVKVLADAVSTMLESNTGDISHSYLKRSGGIWKGNAIEKYTFGNTEVDAQHFMAFMGIYLSEGYVSQKVNKVQITQRKRKEVQEIEELLNKLPLNFNKTTRKNGTIDFVSSNKDLVEYLRPLGKSHEKYIPEDIKNLSPDLLDILTEWMLKGDGRNRHNRKGEVMREVYTTSKQMADDFSEIFFKLGSAASITTRKQKDRMIEGRKILAENSRLLYIVSENTAKNAYLSSRFVNVEKKEYNGNVYCVTVPNGTWMMKRNGKTCWTSNCDHPDDSVVNLKNVSHLVTKMWWNGDDVMGKLEVLDTPSGKVLKALLEAGVKLGISSRGLGSVKESNGVTMVEDDFQLICFDIVSEPSTPGAYLDPEGQSRSRINVGLHENQQNLTKSEKVNNILDDILGD